MPPSVFFLLLLLACCWRPAEAATVRAAGAPVAVAHTTRRGEYVFFPETLAVLPGGNVLLSYQTDADGLHDDGWTGRHYASADGGASWAPVAMPYQGLKVKPCLATGTATARCLTYPLLCTPGAGNRSGHVQFQTFSSTAGQTIRQTGTGNVTMAGFPCDMLVWGPHTFKMVTDGNILALATGQLLTTTYGSCAGQPGYSLHALTSSDHGLSWQHRAVIADAGPATPAVCAAPSENHMVQLPNASLLVVYRSLGTLQPLCMARSDDHGASWTAPVPLNGPFGVEPKLLLTVDRSTLVLSR